MALGYSAQVGDADAYARRNGRRRVFYAVPGGAAPLTGLMSLMDPEDTDGPLFDWEEQRFTEKTATTTPFSAGVAGPWQNGAGVGGSTIAFTLVTPGTTNRAKLKVTSTESMENWDVGERVMIRQQLTSTSNTFVDVNARILEVDVANSVLTLLLDAAVTVDNASDKYGYLVISCGVAYAEGSLNAGTRAQLWPASPFNYTQIWRKAVKMSATAIRQPMYFDVNGKYRTDMRDASVAHMIEIENALMFGRRQKRNVTDADGSATVVRETGGIKYFLELYESSGGGTDSSFVGYRPGQAALTSNTDDDKRIIDGDVNGALTYAFWRSFEERVFRRTMQSMNEKLVIGGTGALQSIIDYYKTRGNIQIQRGMLDDPKLSFTFHTIETHYGTLHLKSHPRFNDRGTLRYDAFILDMQNLKFRPQVGRDTHVKKNTQDPGFDGRKDEFLTEGGFEIRFPESHAYLRNVRSIATS